MKRILLIVAMAITAFGLNAQIIPNADFENWTGNIPDEWDTSNENIMGMVQFTNVTPETGDVASGTTAAKVANTTESIIVVGDITLPGILTLGDFILDIQAQTGGIEGGIPFTYRPIQLKGYFKSAPVGGDKPMIGVGLSKWDEVAGQRDTIGYGQMYFDQTVDTWTEFTIDIEWTSTELPDTMNIIVSATDLLEGGGVFVDGSTIWVDNFSFEYEVGEDLAITAVEPINDMYVPYNTTWESLELPASVEVTLEDESTTELEVSWLQGDYPLNGDVTGTYTLYGDIVLETGIINPDELQAEISVIVQDQVEDAVIVSIESFEPISVEYGTIFENLVLPTQAEVTLDNSSTTVLDITWYQGNYPANGDVPDTYNIIGDVVLIDGVTNPDQITAEISVTINDEVGIADKIANDVRIYPNPSSGLFTVEAENITEVRVIDISGRTIISSMVNSSICSVDMRAYSKGNYVLIINTTNGRHTEKLIVK
jgi:hypothetical protein